MNVLWLSWKDIRHPQAGGAELILHELAKKLIADGHNVTILTVQYAGSSKTDVIDGIKVIRVGSNRYIHPLLALTYYVRHLRNHYDVVIESVNTAPYMSCFFKGKARSILFYHQLARQIWFYEASFPLDWIGYLVLEPVATILLGKSHAQVVTISESTKKDLLRFGFNSDRIHIISEAIDVNPKELPDLKSKYSHPTILSFGSVRAMKRTLDQVKAFEIAKLSLPALQLKVAGDMSGIYGKKVKTYIDNSPYKSDIECLGKVTEKEKVKLMQRCHLFLATSIKEGWCLVVTEAASQGTPAIVYDVDGLRDSVKDGKTGFVTMANPKSMSVCIITIFKDKLLYGSIRRDAYVWSKQITSENCYKDFMKIMEAA